MDQIKFGKFVSLMRAKRGFTQEQLAEKLHISSSKTISKWECGNAVPDFDTIIRLSKVLKVSLFELSIGEKVKKRYITKEILSTLVNKNQLMMISFKRKLIFLFLIIIGIISLISILFTVTNFDTTKVYTLESLNSDYQLYGSYSKNNGFSVFSITELEFIGNNYDFAETEIKNYEYEIICNDKRIYDCNKININNNKPILIYDMINEINLLINSNYFDIENINKNDNLVLKISYFDKTDKNKNKSIEIKIKLIERYSNNKIW